MPDLSFARPRSNTLEEWNSAYFRNYGNTEARKHRKTCISHMNNNYDLSGFTARDCLGVICGQKNAWRAGKWRFRRIITQILSFLFSATFSFLLHAFKFNSLRLILKIFFLKAPVFRWFCFKYLLGFLIFFIGFLFYFYNTNKTITYID